jgi:hypothetical protein
VVRHAVFVTVALSAACSLVVDDTLDGKPRGHAITGGLGGLGGGAAGGTTVTTGGFGPGGGGTGGDVIGGFGGSGGQAVVCAIFDDFDDGVIDPMWDVFKTTSSDVAITEIDGRMEISIPPGSNERWGRVRTSLITTDGCGLTVAYVPSAGAPNGDEVAYAELRQSDALRAGFHLHGPLLKFWTVNGSSQIAVSSVTYQAGVHAWWRLRADESDLVWETSDGTAWIERERQPSHIDVESSEITLGAGVYSGFTSDGLTVRYDNLNVNAPK